MYIYISVAYGGQRSNREHSWPALTSIMATVRANQELRGFKEHGVHTDRMF